MAANTNPSSSLPLFRALSNTRAGYVLRNGKHSYTRCREILKETLKHLGYDLSVYGLHSLRSGGITSVINNETETVFQRDC